MTAVEPIRAFVAALSFLVALIFTTVVQTSIEAGRRRSSFTPLLRQSTLVCAVLALIFLLGTLLPLIPSSIHAAPPPALIALLLVTDLLTFAAVALFRHLVWFLSPRAEPPSRAWVWLNYGSATAMALLALVMPLLIPEAPQLRFWAEASRWSYVLLMLGSSVRRVIGQAKSGGWRAGVMGIASGSDVAVLVAAGLCIATMVVFHWLGGWEIHGDALSLLGAILGVIISLPFAARNLGAVIAGVLTALGSLAACGLVVWGATATAHALASAGLGPAAPLIAAVGLLFVLGPGQAILRAWINRIVFRHSRNERDELRRFLRAISPELGVSECSRLALADLIRVMSIPGAALLFRDSGGVFAGTIDGVPLERVWPRGHVAEALTDRPLTGDDFGHLSLSLREVMSDQDVLGIVPVRGSQRFWGHLLVRTDLVNSLYRDEDVSTTEDFADQLARILDAADLLQRAIAVERSLAHTEKLAAIGELAARIVHDIRNPVTAARSLAQQLLHEPSSPFTEEHGVILEELDRVERQIADLLRFARRDELALEAVDLASLLREILTRLHPRLAAARIAVQLVAPRELVVTADRERIRQVLINLIENAADALTEHDGERRLAVEIGAQNGSSIVRVTDNGPGVPPDTLARIFDPFFSSKPSGTGLGLAIAKRTIEAHGGRIEAQNGVVEGLALALELPLHEPERRDTGAAR